MTDAAPQGDFRQADFRQADFRQEMHDELCRRAIELYTLASLVAGLGLIYFAQVRRYDLSLNMLGLGLALAPLCVWLVLRRHLYACIWVQAALFVALGVGLWLWLGDAVALALLVAPIGLVGVAGGLRIGAVVASAGTLLALMERPTLTHIMVVAVIWMAFGVLWVTMRAAWGASEWSWTSYERMRSMLEEARTQRVHLKEVQDDLNLANAELARVTDRLRAMHHVAEEARRAKEEFVANVSHELRTPLNMIIGFSEVITQNPRLYDRALPAPLLADIEVIQRNAKHLASLVDDVLDLSRVEAGRMALSRENASLSEIVAAAVQAVQPLFQHKGLSLVAEMPPDLPPVYCDRTRVRQVIINLLSNAGRFTDKGGALVRVEQQGPAVVISVADTGPGIPKEDQERIFEPFEQYDGTASRVYGGTGLGLAISRQFVEMHEGKMWVASEPGHGATFFASLPLDGAGPIAVNVGRWFSPYQTYEPRTRPSQAPPPAVAPRVVVMEPSDTVQRLLARYNPGLQVVGARDLTSAAQQASLLPSRALIVNELPASALMHDAAFANALPYGTPLIRCYIPDKGDAATRLGVKAYLLKPLQREALMSALAEVEGEVRSVLLVDDNPEALQLFGRMLASNERKYTIYRASSGDRALALMRQHRPDVVLLDLVMPGMDGYHVLREKAEDETLKAIPVIAVSALDATPVGFGTTFLSVVRGNGINLQEFLSCVQALCGILAPPDQPGDPAQPGAPRA